ncbi:MAG: hypothetical protein LBR53_02415 [Deltaproteobacteria bacterium]|jgi:hypothetical protein|nr:hypothetical protein [Deltaproteobacteria bacterium]
MFRKGTFGPEKGKIKTAGNVLKAEERWLFAKKGGGRRRIIKAGKADSFPRRTVKRENYSLTAGTGKRNKQDPTGNRGKAIPEGRENKKVG